MAASVASLQASRAHAESALHCRVVPLDAARGMAMFFSCLVHFAWWIEGRYPHAARILVDIGMIATPTFLLLSGTVAGFVSGVNPRDIDRVRTTLFNRGLFVLLVGHLAIALTEAHRGGGLIASFPTTYATDTIGVGCILAAMFVASSLRWRWIAISSALFLLCWLVVISWHPAKESLEVAKELLVGRIDSDRRVFNYTSPLLQYLAIYAIGLPVGRWLSDRIQRHDLLSTGKMLVSWGGAALTSGALFRAVRPVSDAEFHGVIQHVFHSTLTIGQKLPPSPAYLLFYGGCGAALTGALCILWHYRVGTFIVQRLAEVGRASLFVFVLQFFTLWTLPDLLGFRPGPTSPFVFFANLLLLWAAARCWTALKGNSWMTFGLRLPRRHASPAH
jgi:uncharacterized membrane protein